MTDKKPEISQAAQASAAGVSASAGTATNSKPQMAAAPKKSRSVLAPAFIVALLIAAGLASALWYQQQQFKQTSASLVEQVQNGTSAANQAAEQSRLALAQMQAQARQIAALESSLIESKSQVESLEQAFRTLTDSGSDLVLINDVDHLLTIAQQQLQLSGNVANAIISLETAQAQLARANRPGLASLLQTINGDLDRLRAASTVDIALLSTQLDELSALVSEASLMVPDDAAPGIVESASVPATGTAPGNGSPADDNSPWWRQALDTAEHWSGSAWSSIRQDLGQFITVRRVDDPTALLMSPDQATRFRENLRLRIMTAQLALMMRQPKVWHAETQAVLKAVETRYDPKAQQTRQALKLARQMADTSIEVRLPTVTNSLQAIEALREASAKSAQDGAIGSSSASPSQPHDEVGSKVEAPSQPDDAPQATPADTPVAEPAKPSAAQQG
ncbi:uroporphyrinogen-III C-methyltransferase [Alcaligenaceae bacterium]|nr:uroporphyrinogen-III C-methyltransferase [Alcaligenaceae bacterium]